MSTICIFGILIALTKQNDAQCDGCSSGTTENGVDCYNLVNESVYACRGTFSNGVSNGASICASEYEICPSASKAKFLGLTDTICGSISKNNEFFTSLQSGERAGQCSNSGTNDIYGCARLDSSNEVNQNLVTEYDGYGCDNTFVASLYGTTTAPGWTIPSFNNELNTASLTNPDNGGVLCCALKQTPAPTVHPTVQPSLVPTFNPTLEPTQPSLAPSLEPTINPTTATPTTSEPTASPTTAAPSALPTMNPTNVPSINPTMNPSKNPTQLPSALPTLYPSDQPSEYPTTSAPSALPTHPAPSSNPTINPTINPTVSITATPTTSDPTTEAPATITPTEVPSTNPTTSSPSSQTTAFSSTDSPSSSLPVPDTPTQSPNQPEDAESAQEEEFTFIIDVYLAIGASAVIYCLIMFCVIFLCCMKHKRNKQKEIETKASKLKVHSVTPVSVIDSPTMSAVNMTPVNIGDNRLSINSPGHEDMANIAMAASFGTNLTNLSTANNVLMDDIVDDMENGEEEDDDDEEVDLRGIVTKGGSFKGGPGDIKYQKSDSDSIYEEVIGAALTMGE